MHNAALAAPKPKVSFNEIHEESIAGSSSAGGSEDVRAETSRPANRTQTVLLAKLSARQQGSAETGRKASFSLVPDLSGLHGTLDQKMAAIHQQFLAIFRREAGPDVATRAQPVLDLLCDPDASFEARRTAVDAFVDHFKHDNPQALVDLVKLIDCQLTVYSVVEDQSRLAATPKTLSLDDSIGRLVAECGEDAQAINARLAAMTVAPVLTAHPTNLHNPEALMQLHQACGALHDPAALRDACTGLWRASGARPRKPSVRTEAEGNLPHLQRMQREIRRIHKSIDGIVGAKAGQTVIRQLVRPESWIGGDRDGNILVDAATMKDIMALQAGAALSRYGDKLGRDRLNKEGSLRSLLDRHAPGEADKIARRIDATRRKFGGAPETGDVDRPQAYSHPQQLIDDLVPLRGALPPGDAQAKLSRFVREVQGAGFHTAAVDVRQNSKTHQESVAELLASAGVTDTYATLPEADKQTLLWQLLTGPDDQRLYSTARNYSQQTAEEMEIFRAIGDIHACHGQQAMPNYIIANTETVSDLLEPMLLLKQVGLAGPGGLKMKIVPLIETVPDLQNGREIVGALLQHPQYRAWLADGDNTQQVMVGYSDSNRLDGPLASNWAIEKALHYLQDVTHENGVQLLVFHGRGGTVARGAGADARHEVEMLPAGVVRHGYRATDQGEKIAIKYGTADAAAHNLRSTAAATIAAAVAHVAVENPEYHAVMEQLSSRSSEAYRAFVIEDPKLIDFFNEATPVGYTPHLNAGSRAASRNNLVDQKVNLAQLRAIPWVAGWTQSRAMLPAFLGIGTALEEHVRPGGTDQPVDPARVEQLQAMYRDWPFFTQLVDRTEVELAKVDLEIVGQYAGLVRDRSTGVSVHAAIAAEFGRARDIVLAIKQNGALLENDPVQQASIARRAPALDTANALQISLMDAERQATDDQTKSQLLKAVVGSMQAIQSGIGRFG